MRGILLLLVGACLVWIGLMGTGGGDSAGVDPEGDGTAAPEWRPAEEPAVQVSAAPEEPSAMSGEPSAMPGAGADRDEGDSGSSAPSGGAPSEVQSEELASSAFEEQVAPEPAVPAQDLGPAVQTFELEGPGSDSVALGQTLLEAWIAQDPTALGTLLNGPEGEKVTPERRRLVAAFWQAMVGKPELGRKELKALEASEAVRSGELVLLQRALEPGLEGARPASSGRVLALELAMEMVLLESRARAALTEGRNSLAAEDLSDLIHMELAAPWAPHKAVLLGWAADLRLAQSGHRLSKKGGWPSIQEEVVPGDSLVTVRKRALRSHPELVVCTGLIERVNEVRGYIHPGDRLRIPSDTPNVLVDLDARLVVYRHGEEAVLAWECGVGKEGHATPPGRYVVGEKLSEPTWFPPGQEPIPYGDPDNALGDRWIAWYQGGKATSFGFHGTNDPAGVGGKVSQGCIRMRNDEVSELFELLPVGAEVLIQP